MNIFYVICIKSFVGEHLSDKMGDTFQYVVKSNVQPALALTLAVEHFSFLLHRDDLFFVICQIWNVNQFSLRENIACIILC